MKRHVRILGLSLVIAFAVVSVCAAQEPKVAVVDIMQFTQKSLQAQESHRKLQNLRVQKKQALDRKVDELRSLKEKFEKQGPMLKEETRNAMIRDMSVKETELKLAEQEAQTSFQSAVRDAEQTLQQDLTKVIAAIRAEKKLSLVIQANALFSYDEALDITDEVISRYDAAHGGPGKPTTKAPAPTPPAPPKPKPAPAR
jgi:outer membrane protein